MRTHPVRKIVAVAEEEKSSRRELRKKKITPGKTFVMLRDRTTEEESRP